MLQCYINSVKIIGLYLKNAKHTIHIIKWSKKYADKCSEHFYFNTQWFVELYLASALKRKHYISVEHGYHGNVYYEARVYTSGRVFIWCHLSVSTTFHLLFFHPWSFHLLHLYFHLIKNYIFAFQVIFQVQWLGQVCKQVTVYLKQDASSPTSSGSTCYINRDTQWKLHCKQVQRQLNPPSNSMLWLSTW